MRRFASRTVVLAAILIIGQAATARGQSFEPVSTRAQGMAGAFVAVSDDASAVYWNPAALAKGAYFSLILDGNSTSATPAGSPAGADRGSWLLALSTPAVGLSYYRLQTTTVRPVSPSLSRVESLVTQHLGATLVQSITDGVAVGTTVKLVRGVAAEATAPTGDPNDLLGVDLIGDGGNRPDLDIGIMAAGSFGRAGLTMRNVSEPGFETGVGGELRLQRQLRGGAAIMLLQTWKLAADLDLLKTDGPFGEIREFSLGTEGQLTRRVAARGGIRLNTADGSDRAPGVSAGGSFAVFGSLLLDAQITAGSDKAFRGWGLAGRMVF
jgi:hypothetical protein